MVVGLFWARSEFIPPDATDNAGESVVVVDWIYTRIDAKETNT